MQQLSKRNGNHHTVASFDDWIRGRFVEINTALEEVYFVQADRNNVEGVGDDLKKALLLEGTERIAAVFLANPTIPDFDDAFDLLGNVGYFMAACKRHGLGEADNRSTLLEASILATRLGIQIDVVPRTTTNHLQIRNLARNAEPKAFTSLPDEALFSNYNVRAQFAFMRAAEALTRIKHLGVSHPVTLDELTVAQKALADARRFNATMFRELDTERFYFCIRPYFMSHRVGHTEYRGVNAGDFAAVNQIDLLLGLCSAGDPSYLATLNEKNPYLLPEDRHRLAACLDGFSLMDELLAPTNGSGALWLKPATEMFLQVCVEHGAFAAQHHNMLVKKFIVQPSERIEAVHLKKVTASGPPLEVLLLGLERIRDLRQAANRSDIPSRFTDVERLKAIAAG
jgi:hypothetical protein